MISETAGDLDRHVRTARDRSASLEDQGVRHQFMIGVALLFVVPLLALWCAMASGILSGSDPSTVLLLGLLIGVVALAGFALLKRAPLHIVRIRNRLEQVVDTELAHRAHEAPVGSINEIQAIDACMKIIVDELRTRMDAMQSERRKLQDKLIQAEKIVALGTMATGVAHDFNNLMAAVVGNVNILLRGLPPDSKLRENALQIHETAQQAVKLTNRVALYAGHARVDFSEVDLSAVVREISEALRASVPKGISIELKLDESLPPVRADVGQMRDVVASLVHNATEATVSRRGTITISTGIESCDHACLADTYLQRSMPEGRYEYIQVADEGEGISDEVRARMFDPFYTSKIRAQGMGLATVLGIVRGHGGAIQVHSVPGQGTTFRVLLPCDETERVGA